VNVALPDIEREFGASFSDLQWVISAYALTLAAFLLTAGSLADLYGRRLLFATGIVVFTVGSLCCGLATSSLFLTLARGGQGVGGAIMFATALALLAQAFQGRDRGVALGLFGGITGIAIAVGPVLGGAITSGLSWRWVFYVNLPIGAVALAISTRLRLPAGSGRARIDVLGAALLGAGLTAILLVTTWGGREYAWGSPEIVGLAVAAVVLLAGFFAQERRAPEPVLPLRMFREPVFDVVSAVLFLTTCAFFAAIVFLPLFLQRVTGASAVQSGLQLLPLLLAGTLSTAVIGRVVTRTGRYKVFPAVGLGLMAIGLFLLSRLDETSSHATIALDMVVFGLGFGMVSQLLVLAIQNAVDRRDIGIATASANLFRSLGGSVGAALFGAIFASRVSAGAGPGEIADALDTVFLAAAPVAALALVVVLFLKEKPLRGPSAKAATA